ncbi:tetratricopeptide repeat protein [Paraburkholderia denitrificans]|uniref:Tetratricopeptide repeat protein n=1 Tax=Paraburkholderia denitrificans TaxID=694025 RepID=A0ABW0JEB5_9BURK
MNGSTGMWIFVVLAVVIVGAFGASLYWAGGRRGASRRQSVVLAMSVPLVVGGLYAVRGETAALEQASPHSQMGASGASQQMHDGVDMNAEIQHLADHLKQHPEDMDGWVLLARSYTMLGRYPDAAAAYEHAQPRVMKDSSLLTGWIEARLMSNDHRFDAHTLDLVDSAAKLAPDDTNVLLLRALAANERGDRAGANKLVDELHKRYPAGSPDRQDLDAALARWMPQGAAKQ